MAPKRKKAKIEGQGQGSASQREYTHPPGFRPFQPALTQFQPRFHILEITINGVSVGRDFWPLLAQINQMPADASQIQEGAEPGPPRSANPGPLMENQKANP